MTPAMLKLLRAVWEEQDQRVLSGYAALAQQYRAHLLIDPVAALGSPLPGREELLSLIRSGTLSGAQDVLILAAAEAGISPPERDLIFQTIGDYYHLHLPALVDGMQGDMGAKVGNAIQKGLDSGMNERDLGTHVLGAVLPYGAARLRTIARTELTNAATLSRVGVWAQIGHRLFEYRAILDDVTTKTCRCLEGAVLDMSTPAAQALAPANHYRCRALLVPAEDGAQASPAQVLERAAAIRAREFPSWGDSRLSPAIAKLMGQS